MAIGRKHGGAITEGGSEYCITAYVVRKFDPNELSARNIPDAYTVCNQAAVAGAMGPPPHFLSPQDVNVVETGDVFRLDATYAGSSHAQPASVNTQKWFAKMRPGIGIANPTGTYPDRLVGGTCGLFAKRKNPDGTETIYLVSCNHIIAREKTSEQPPPPGQAVLGEMVIQPATMDLAGSDISRLNFVELTRDFGVATLSAVREVDVYLPPNPSPPCNQMDAALAELSGDRSADHANLSRLPYGGRFMGEHEYTLDDNQNIQGSAAVFKCGRSSGYTEGLVTAIDGILPVDFAMKKAMFTRQIMIQCSPDNTGRFSEPGDSGSAVVTDDHRL